jgi:hypothetical protein
MIIPFRIQDDNEKVEGWVDAGNQTKECWVSHQTVLNRNLHNSRKIHLIDELFACMIKSANLFIPVRIQDDTEEARRKGRRHTSGVC